jgi:nitric oxide dioxygenase
VHTRYSDATADDRARGLCDSEGFVDGPLIESLIPGRDADYYFCGPKPFMVNIYHQLLEWGIPATQVHLEFFGPRQELQRPAACPV